MVRTSPHVLIRSGGPVKSFTLKVSFSRHVSKKQSIQMSKYCFLIGQHSSIIWIIVFVLTLQEMATSEIWLLSST